MNTNEIAEKSINLAKKMFKNYTQTDIDFAKEIIELETNLKALQKPAEHQEKAVKEEVKTTPAEDVVKPVVQAKEVKPAEVKKDITKDIPALNKPLELDDLPF